MAAIVVLVAEARVADVVATAAVDADRAGKKVDVKPQVNAQ
jgi:hypothetical protein